MKTIKFENLIDNNTGKTLGIEETADFDENSGSIAEAGERSSRKECSIKQRIRQY